MANKNKTLARLERRNDEFYLAGTEEKIEVGSTIGKKHYRKKTGFNGMRLSFNWEKDAPRLIPLIESQAPKNAEAYHLWSELGTWYHWRYYNLPKPFVPRDSLDSSML